MDSSSGGFRRLVWISAIAGGMFVVATLLVTLVYSLLYQLFLFCYILDLWGTMNPG